MALSRASAMFKLYQAKYTHRQRVKLRPNEHHYENEGEEPYIKYSCQLCEQNVLDIFYIEDEIMIEYINEFAHSIKCN